MVLNSSEFERALISIDGTNLARIVSTGPSIVSMAFYGPLAMFAFESFKRLRALGMARGSFGEHGPAIEKARHAVKFLDDTRRPATAIVKGYGSILDAHQRRFIGAHKGLLAPLKRRLSTDLGLYHLDGKLVATTHGLSAQLGLDDEALHATSTSEETTSTLLHNRARALGQYTATLVSARKIEADLSERGPIIDVSAQDVRASHYYASACRSDVPSSLALGVALAALLARSNTMLYLAPRLMCGDEALSAVFITKWRVIALVHALSSINHILRMPGGRELLTKDAAEALVALRRSLKTSARLKDTRHGLVHYDATKLPKDWLVGLGPLVEQNLTTVSKTLSRLFPQAGPTRFIPASI